MKDGLLELVCFKGAVEVGAVAKGLGKGKRIGQASIIHILIKNPGIAIQMDGEPWKEEEPLDIKICIMNQARMLMNDPK